MFTCSGNSDARGTRIGGIGTNQDEVMTSRDNAIVSPHGKPDKEVRRSVKNQESSEGLETSESGILFSYI